MVDKKMNFDPFIFQPAICDRLNKIVVSGKIGSAYIFSGPEGSAKEAIAISFAASLNCHGKEILCGKCTSCIRFASMQHEHLQIIVPLPRGKDSIDKDTDVLTIIGKQNETLLTELLQKKGLDPFQKIKIPRAKRILINSIRELRKKLYLKSVDYGYKTVLIFDAHYLSDGDGASANALLKILEEPPEKTIIILVTDHKSILLSTIQSRCQHINFPPLQNNKISQYLQNKGLSRNESLFFAYLSDGNMHRARFLADHTLDEILKTIKNQVEVVVNRNGNNWRTYINTMSRMVRNDPDEFKFQLYLLQIWFQQSFRLRQNLESPLTQNGLAEGISAFTTSFPKADLASVNTVIENTLDSINRNFYMPLTLTNMLVDIQHYLKGNA